jgi:signal transduction histidine kinase
VSLRDSSAFGTPRLAWAAGALLVVLLVALAALQLRWLRAVADADRQRLEAGVENALDGLTSALDREVSRAWLTFHDPGGPPPTRGDVAALRERWRETSPYPQLVEDLVLLTRTGQGTRAERLDEAGRWQPLTAAPPGLADLPTTLRRSPQPPGGPPPGGRRVARREPDAAFTILRPRLPGLVLPLGPPPGSDEAAAGPAETFLAVVFDRDFLARELLPALSRRYLEPLLGPRLQMRVATQPDGEVVYTSEPSLTGDFDWEVPVFDVLPPDELRRLAFGERRFDRELRPRHEGGGLGAAIAAAHDRHEHRMRSAWPWRQRAGWVVALRPAAGSLDAALARAHLGNAALALGILFLLALAAAALALSARRAQALAQRQLEFTAAVSHELRTPLAAIRSLAENLADGVVREPEQTRHYGAQIAAQGARLSAMVEQVLSLAADSRQGGAPRRLPVDPAALIRDVVEEAVTGAPEARVDTDIGPLPELVGDPSGLRHALGNLVGNALRHGGRPPWARVRARLDEERSEVRIAVSDRGPGVPEGDRERLFEPFFRGENAREGQLPGAGLGLHLARRAAAAHRGRIELESAPGEGSTFTLVLPAGSGTA